MSGLLVLGLFVVLSRAHTITELEVPAHCAPGEVALGCAYAVAAGDPAIHSVKWYRDGAEIFRYTPRQDPEVRIFNDTDRSVTVRGGACAGGRCRLQLRLTARFGASFTFTCEVSTERPRFDVVTQNKTLTIAAVLKEAPEISGGGATVTFGEEVMLNCSTRPAHPPPDIAWFVDGRPQASEWLFPVQRSAPDATGRVSSWRVLRHTVLSRAGEVRVRCEASQPLRPVPRVSAERTLHVVKLPYLSMYTAASRGMSYSLRTRGVLALVSCLLVYLNVFSVYSSLSEV